MKKRHGLLLFIALHLYGHDTYMQPNPDLCATKQKKVLKGVGAGVLACYSIISLVAVKHEYNKISNEYTLSNLCGMGAALGLTGLFTYGTYCLGKDIFK